MPEERDWDGRGEILLLGGATVFLAIVPLALLFAPITLAALVFRRGLRVGIAVAILSGLAATLVSLNPLILAQVLLVLALGIALGEGMREGLSAGQIVAVGTGVAMVTTILLKIAVERVTGLSIDEIIAGFWQEVFAGVGGSDTRPEMIEAMVAQTERTLPASLLVGSLALTVVDLSLTRRLLARLPGGVAGVPSLPPFGEWRFHKGISIGFVVGWFLGTRVGLGDGFLEPGLVDLVLLNATFILGAFASVQGVAVAWHLLKRWRISGVIATVLIVLALLLPVVPMLFLGVGLIDPWVDLRKRGGSRSR